MGTNSIENELEIFKSKRIIEDVIGILNFKFLYILEKFHDVELYKDTNPFNVLKLINEEI
jgi:uncharacterized protein involved in exopolysaccharide biosynthesis